MRLRYNLGAGKYVEYDTPLTPKEMTEKLNLLDMEKLLVLTDADGGLTCAINPRMIVAIEVL